MLQIKEGDVLYDLGCGDGRLLIEVHSPANCFLLLTVVMPTVTMKVFVAMEVIPLISSESDWIGFTS